MISHIINPDFASKTQLEKCDAADIVLPGTYM